MSNTAYLCVTDAKTTYPSFATPDYDAAEQTVACDVNAVPLLWLALFRPADLVRATFTPDGGPPVETVAPLALKSKALKQLKAAAPYLTTLFGRGKLDAHAALLAKALRAADGKYVTVELEEIAALTDPPEAFYAFLRQALAGIHGDSTPDAAARFATLCCLRPGRPFPPATLLFCDDAHDDDVWNHCRLLGASHERPVPWEPGGSDDGPPPDLPLLVAVRGGDLAKVRELLAAGADPNEPDYLGATCLFAAAYQSPEFVATLLAAGAKVCRNTVYKAVEQQPAATVERLLRAGGDANEVDSLAKEPAVVRATYVPKDDVAKVRLLVAAGADLTKRDCDRRTALMKAAEFGRVAVVEYLLTCSLDSAAVAEALEYAKKTCRRQRDATLALLESFPAG